MSMSGKCTCEGDDIGVLLPDCVIKEKNASKKCKYAQIIIKNKLDINRCPFYSKMNWSDKTLDVNGNLIG